MLIHSAFILVVFILALAYRQNITIHCIQVLYYFICTITLLLGMGWLCSSLNVFSRDVTGIVNIFLQVFFWASPIIWSSSQINDKILMILKINPLFYICEGYRNCFVYHRWFWDDIGQTCYFWGLTIVILLVGSGIFSKLSPYFDDVL